IYFRRCAGYWVFWRTIGRSARRDESSMMPVQSTSVPRNWITSAMFVLTFATAVTVVPWYGFKFGYHAAAWIWFTLLLGANGMAITCGYHRLFSHATYEAHPVLKV